MSKKSPRCPPRDIRRILSKTSHLAEKNLQKARKYEDTDDYDYVVEADGDCLPELNVEAVASSTALETSEAPQPNPTHTPVNDNAALRGSLASEELEEDEIGLDCQTSTENNPSNEATSQTLSATDSVNHSTSQPNTTHTPVDDSAALRGSLAGEELEEDEIGFDCQSSTDDTSTDDDILQQPLSTDSVNPNAPQSNTQYTSNNASASNRDSPDSNSAAVTTVISHNPKIKEAAKADEFPVPIVTKPPAQENAEPLDVEIVQTGQPQMSPYDLLPVNDSFNSCLPNEVKAEPQEPAQTLRPSTGNSNHGKKQVDECLNPMQLAKKIAGKYPLRQMNDTIYLHRCDKCPCYSIPNNKALNSLVFETYEDLCMKKGSTSYINNISAALEFFVSKVSKDEVEENERRYIATLNHIIDLLDDRVLPLTPEIFIRHYLNVRYDSSACYYPVFKRFLETATDGDEDLEEAIWEMMAYLLFPSEFQKAFFVLIGPAHSGKSSLLDLIQSFFPNEDVSNVTLQDFGGNYTSGSIAEARINIDADLPDTPITRKGMSEIKKITGGDRIMANKKHVQAYACRPKTKLLFASNFPLKIACKDDAFLKRMHILPFTVVIPDDEQDKELFGKLQKEKSAIYNEVYKRYIKLRSNGFMFTCCDSGEDNLVFSKTESESANEIIQAFFDRYLEYTGDRSDFTSTAEISELFRNYCAEIGQKQYIQGFQQAFSKFINQSSMDEITSTRRGPNKARGYCALRVAEM